MFCLPTLFPKVKCEDGCRTSNKREHETVETKRSIYLHFHMCLTFGDVKLHSQKALNRTNMCAICFKRPSRLWVMCLSPHFKSVFHINWLVYSMIDKPQSEKGQRGRGGRETSVCEWAMFCCHTHLCLHISIFILTHFLTRRQRLRKVTEEIKSSFFYGLFCSFNADLIAALTPICRDQTSDKHTRWSPMKYKHHWTFLKNR